MRHTFSRERGKMYICNSSSEANDLLSAGLEKYVAGDKMGALNYWEDCLNKSPSPEDRLAALWNSMCVHAYFGDAEVAQISLREAVALGLDFENGLKQTDPRFVRLQASAQVIIQLRRFSVATAKAMAAAESSSATSAAGTKQRVGTAAAGSSKAYRTPSMKDDVSDLTQTDMIGLDTSVLGVVRRVAVLLLALIGLGVALFYFGLQYTFPVDQ